MARPETKVLEMRIKECVGVEITRDAKRSVYVQNAGNSTVNAYHTAGEPANHILPCRRRHSSTLEGVSMPPCLGVQDASSCSNRLEEQSPFLSPNRPKRRNIWRLSGSIDPLQLPGDGFGKHRTRCSLPGTRSALHDRLSTLTTLQPRNGFLAKSSRSLISPAKSARKRGCAPAKHMICEIVRGFIWSFQKRDLI
jgi:hypothetical protein